MSLTVRSRPGTASLYITGTVTIWRAGEPHPVRIDRSSRTSRRDEAEAIARQIERETAEANILGRAPAPSFAAALTAYLDAGGEARFLDRPLARLGPMPIDTIDQAVIDREGLAAYPTASPATLRRQWHGVVIAVLRHAGIATAFRRPRAPGQRTDWILPKAADAMIEEAATGRRRAATYAPALLTLLFGQGLRLSEALALEAPDILLDHRLAAIREPKNGAERWITLQDRTIAALSCLPTLRHPGPFVRSPVIRNKDGQPYRTGGDHGGQITAIWARCARAAGLDPKVHTPHTARHSWATWFYAQTRDVVRLKAEGGWKSSQWERYTHIARPSIGEEARSCGWRFDAEAGTAGREAANA